MPPGVGYQQIPPRRIGGFFDPDALHPAAMGPSGVVPRTGALVGGAPGLPVPGAPSQGFVGLNEPMAAPDTPGMPMSEEEKRRRMAIMQAGLGLLDFTPSRTPQSMVSNLSSAATQAFPGFFGGL